MKRILIGLALFVCGLAAARGLVYGAEEKPLAPGWLSLDGSVGLLDKSIADAKSSVENALGISISGYLDAGYNWSSNHPRIPRNISGRYFDKDHNKLVFNDLNITIDKPEKDWGVGFRLSGDFGRTAELLREATLWGKTFHREPSAELREAFLTTTIPVGAGLQVKGGLFVTPHGTEVIPAPNAYNENISRSFLFNFAIPFRHLGVMLSYPVAEMLTVSGGVVTGWDNPRDNNDQPSFMGGLAITPSAAVSLNVNVMYGPETRSNGRDRFVWSNVLTLKPIDPLALFLEYTYGHEEKASLGGTRDATWQGVAGIASYGWTDRFSTALRGEVFNDRDGARLGGELVGNNANVTLAEVTLTGSYKFTKMFLGRAEIRQDWADERFYKRGGSNADKNQTTLALQLIYTY
jgi:Putative beta-barrel porin-2, OmpL-like. bbp2